MTARLSREKKAETAEEYCVSRDTDVYVYNGPIDDLGAFELIQRVSRQPRRRADVSLFLTTYGGDADAAYRLTRCLQRSYRRFRLLIGGPCKSAGTLVATGAHELIFGRDGELGPLDVQLTRPDEMVPSSSGLDTLAAFDNLSARTLDTFLQYMLGILRRSDWTISTRTACDVAGRLTGELIEPIAAQIDPYRLAEAERSMEVARAYGVRLQQANLRYLALERLTSFYPCHSFVIDEEEARKLFNEVSTFSPADEEIFSLIGHCACNSRNGILVKDLAELAFDEGEGESAQSYDGDESDVFRSHASKR